MWQVLVSTAQRLVQRWSRPLLPGPATQSVAPAARSYRRLERVLLTDEVSRTLFEEYQAHRKSARGEEETGWVLLGLREVDQAVVLATLPAGAESNAGVAHVRFNSNAQALASRIVRQWERRLNIIGVVHTHPGSLRHPSDADFQGDRQWVGNLRGGDGVFAIGTADAVPGSTSFFARQPKPHRQVLEELCFSWYGLEQGDKRYRPLPVNLTLGPDLARPLHPLWLTIEAHADALDRLCRQQARLSFDLLDGPGGPALAVNLILAEPHSGLRLILEGEEVRYYILRDGDLVEVDPKEGQVDRGVYLVLAELAS
jgi:proteasome lid subunit RPN8/RPN11